MVLTNTQTRIVVLHEAKWVVKMCQSVPFTNVEVIFVHKQVHIMNKGTFEARVLSVLQRLGTGLVVKKDRERDRGR